MRRLASLPIALFMTLVITSAALASFCGNDSKGADRGQHATLWVTIATGEVVVDGGNAQGKLTGGFVDVYLDFPPSAGFDCFIDDTYILSEHEIGHIAAGQLLDGLAVNPAVHRGNNPGGSAGVGFASITSLTADCPFGG